MERVTNLPCPPPNTSTGSTPALCRPPIVPRTTLSSHAVHRLSLALAASGRECIEGGSSGRQPVSAVSICFTRLFRLCAVVFRPPCQPTIQGSRCSVPLFLLYRPSDFSIERLIFQVFSADCSQRADDGDNNRAERPNPGTMTAHFSVPATL